jgi:cGMP-dependent protein kinase 2
VWEFLSSQTVVDMVGQVWHEGGEPLAACRAVVAESYRLWLQFDVRTDDITMILAFIDKVEEKAAMMRQASSAGRASIRGSISVGGDAVKIGGARPVRRGLSREKREAIAAAAADDDAGGKQSLCAPRTARSLSPRTRVSPHACRRTLVTARLPLVVVRPRRDNLPEEAKTKEELQRISDALSKHYLFKDMETEQQQQAYRRMRRVHTQPGQVIYAKDEEATAFFVLDSGEYAEQTYFSDGAPSEVYSICATAASPYPTFGELALINSRPRKSTRAVGASTREHAR